PETERGGVESAQSRTRTRRYDDGAIRAPISAVAQWLAGATTTLSRTPTASDKWERDERAAALECLTNWLTLVPIGCDPREVARSRLHAMSGWVRPAWRHLKCEHSGASWEADPEWALIRAQLEGWCDSVGAEEAPMQEAGQPETDRYHLVLRTPIAQSQDRYDREYLESYSVLSRPLPVAGDASRETLWELARRLGAEFPWAHNVVQAIVGEMMACATYGVSRGLPRPVLLVGRPGSGKTRFAVRLAELLGVPNTIINLAGMHDAKLLKGTTRGWASARPSRIVEFLAQARVANPLFVMDEIDKMSDQTDCYAQHALLDLLESANAARYHDVFLLAECDLSRCQYIATANSLASLSRALVSRFHVVVFPYPGAEYAGAVVKQVVADLEREWGLTAGTIDLLGFDVQVCHGLPPRAIRQVLMNWIGQKALTRSWLH
ncbi:MAG: AAA family ATPase, partial [Dyella sp.]|nr:AAA family ATPase [Dyella sp.]